MMCSNSIQRLARLRAEGMKFLLRLEKKLQEPASFSKLPPQRTAAQGALASECFEVIRL